MSDYHGTCDGCHRNRETAPTDRFILSRHEPPRRLRYCRECLDRLGIVLRRDQPDSTEPAAPLTAEAGTPIQLTAADPWAHRGTTMRCATCMWYVPKRPPADRAPASDALGRVVELGRCRRHAPTMGGYPAVYPADWCGDHKLDETKL